MATENTLRVIKVDGPKPYYLLRYKLVDGWHVYPVSFVDRAIALRTGRTILQAA